MSTEQALLPEIQPAVAPISTAPVGRPGQAFNIDADHFRSHFGQKPHLVAHRLAGHPSFSLPRLIELARRQPEKYVEYNAGNIGVTTDWEKTPRTGLSVEESIRRIEECNSWMFLKRVEHDPEYRELLDQVLDDVQEHSEAIDPGMYDRAAAIFISSPGAVTPYHMDQEHNYLCQIRGQKTIRVYPGREVLGEEELENHLTRKSYDRNLVFRPEFEAKATVFDLTPGHALYFPPLDPHYVLNGPEVSISFSCGFFTPRSDRRWGIHRFNRGLRRWGITPAPYGASPWRDSLKFLGCRVSRRVGRWFGAGAVSQ
jgi:hypothetical protein